MAKDATAKTAAPAEKLRAAVAPGVLYIQVLSESSSPEAVQSHWPAAAAGNMFFLSMVRQGRKGMRGTLQVFVLLKSRVSPLQSPLCSWVQRAA